MQQMLSHLHLRARPYGQVSLAASALFWALNLSAQTLPATLPTAQTAAQVAPIAATAPAGQPALPAHRAEVTYADGMLDVRTNNSSLHQVLRAIARVTGMTITGGVADERVFGDYGPAAPSTVLATLLDGTGTNLLLRDGDATRPMELVLTPRTGGATPPMAATPIGMDADDTSAAAPQRAPTQPYTAPTTGTILPGEDARSAARRLGPPSPYNNQSVPNNQNTSQQQSTPQPMPQPMNNVNGSPANTTPTASQIPTTNSVPLDSVPTPSTTPAAAQGIVDTPNPPAPDSTTGTGAKTPEQIYQQILQMQQKQQQQSPPAQPATPTTPPGGPSN